MTILYSFLSPQAPGRRHNTILNVPLYTVQDFCRFFKHNQRKMFENLNAWIPRIKLHKTHSPTPSRPYRTSESPVLSTPPNILTPKTLSRYAMIINIIWILTTSIQIHPADCPYIFLINHSCFLPPYHRYIAPNIKIKEKQIAAPRISM